jgi:hypothetical protein
VDYNQHPAKSVQPKGQESLLASGVGIFSGESQGVSQCCFGITERHPMQQPVSLVFCGIELDQLGADMHMICISARLFGAGKSDIATFAAKTGQTSTRSMPPSLARAT